MTLRLFIGLLIISAVGFLIWVGLTRTLLSQTCRLLFSGISIISILITSFILFLTLVFGWRTPAPPTPAITYGEFPFRLEYEIDGERFVIEDIVIAEFVRSAEGNPTMIARRIWNTTLLNGYEGGHLGNERSFLLKI